MQLQEVVEAEGHLIDSHVMEDIFDKVVAHNARFEVPRNAVQQATHHAKEQLTAGDGFGIFGGSMARVIANIKTFFEVRSSLRNLRSHKADERRLAILTLQNRPTVVALPLLHTIAKDDDYESVRINAIKAIGALLVSEEELATPPLLDLIDDANPRIRVAAISELTFCLMSKTVKGAVRAKLEDDDADVRAAAVSAMAVIDFASSAEAIILLLGDSSPIVVDAAARALALMGHRDPRTVLALGSILKTGNLSKDTRDAVCRGLMKIGTYHALKVLSDVGYQGGEEMDFFPPHAGSRISTLVGQMRESCCSVRLTHGSWGPESRLESLGPVKAYANQIRHIGSGLFARGGREYMRLAYNEISTYVGRDGRAASALQLLKRYEAQGWAYDEDRSLAILALSSSPHELVSHLWKGIGGWI